MPEQFANNSETTLDGGIDSSQTSIDVVANASFPQTAPFRILVENEIMLVTAGAGTDSWTVTRGHEGTIAASHSGGTEVRHGITAGAIDQFRADTFLSDVYSARPAAGTAGRLFIPTDGPLFYRDNGVSWDAFGPLSKFTPPIDGDFSWVNQGSAAIIPQGTALVLSIPAVTTQDWRLRVKTAPAAPFTITAGFTFVASNTQSVLAGNSEVALGFRESGSGELHMFGLSLTSNNDWFFSSKWTDHDSVSANYTLLAGPSIFGQTVIWMRIQDDGSNRKCFFSANGFDWVEFHSIGNTDFLTADQVCWAGKSITNRVTYATLHSWEES